MCPRPSSSPPSIALRDIPGTKPPITAEDRHVGTLRALIRLLKCMELVRFPSVSVKYGDLAGPALPFTRKTGAASAHVHADHVILTHPHAARRVSGSLYEFCNEHLPILPVACLHSVHENMVWCEKGDI